MKWVRWTNWRESKRRGKQRNGGEQSRMGRERRCLVKSGCANMVSTTGSWHKHQSARGANSGTSTVTESCSEWADWLRACYELFSSLFNFSKSTVLDCLCHPLTALAWMCTCVCVSEYVYAFLFTREKSSLLEKVGRWVTCSRGNTCIFVLPRSRTVYLSLNLGPGRDLFVLSLPSWPISLCFEQTDYSSWFSHLVMTALTGQTNVHLASLSPSTVEGDGEREELKRNKAKGKADERYGGDDVYIFFYNLSPHCTSGTSGFASLVTDLQM